MAINFRKLNAQIRPLKKEVRPGYIFLATDEQKNRFVDSVAKLGSRRKFMRTMLHFIQCDKDYADEFTL